MWSEFDKVENAEMGIPEEGELELEIFTRPEERNAEARQELKEALFLSGVPRPPKSLYEMESDLHIYGTLGKLKQHVDRSGEKRTSMFGDKVPIPHTHHPPIAPSTPRPHHHAHRTQKTDAAALANQLVAMTSQK